MDSHTSYSLSVILVVLLASASATTTLGATDFSFTFYVHNNQLGTLNPSADAVTLPSVFSTIGSLFGQLVAFDDSATVAPDPNSLEIGRARGLYLFDANDNKGPGIELVWTLQLNAASGTTLSFAGFDRTTDATREISIIGGTGLFRYARGYAVFSTYSPGPAEVLSVTATFTYGL